MKKETLFVAFTNQKGGVGKSAFTILMADYTHYLKKNKDAIEEAAKTPPSRQKKDTQKYCETFLKGAILQQESRFI